MPKFHFYDIECLKNVFTLTNYIPEKNKVEQYFLLDDKLRNKIARELGENPEQALKQGLTNRVRLRNPNFNPGLKVNFHQSSTGTSEPLDLKYSQNNMRLAKEFGVSTAYDVCDPTDASSIYPAGLRPACDTDLENKDKKWQPENVNKTWQHKLSDARLARNDSETRKLENAIIKNSSQWAKLNYRNYDDEKMPYLLGYNSDNYDLTLLSVYFQDLFNEQIPTTPKDLADFVYSHNQYGYHFFKLCPDKPEILRRINNIMFSANYNKSMPSILYREPKDASGRKMNLHNAFMIRKNMIRTDRHLDVSNLNEKMKKVGLKRLLGMKGYQILESNKLQMGTDTIENLDQFYELLAYNASDCINLAALFSDTHYQGQFSLKKSLLKTYPMIVYQKQKNAYAPDIAPDKVKKRRMLIDSTSADIATNVVCPYGHLDDIPAVSFNYPEIRKSKQVGIPQFNVLKQTREFFNKNVYQPALKTNITAANTAKRQFDRIMSFYAFVEGKNFNDAINYYAKQLTPYNEKLKDWLYNLKDEDYVNILSDINTFELLMLNNKEISLAKNSSLSYANVDYNYNRIHIPQSFIQANMAEEQAPAGEDGTPNKPLSLSDLTTFWQWLLTNIPTSDSNTMLAKEIKKALQTISRNNPEAKVATGNAAAFLNGEDSKKPDLQKLEQAKTRSNMAYQELREFVNAWIKQIFGKDWTLETWRDSLYHNWLNARFHKPVTVHDLKVAQKKNKAPKIKYVYQFHLRPYTNQDLPKNNYCLPFYKKDATPTAGYAVFSVGGIHGAEYNQKLYLNDVKKWQQKEKEVLKEKQMQENSQISLLKQDMSQTKPKTQPAAICPYVLFKKKGSNYELNSRYVYTSLDPVNHEDFSSYYPSMCRMLNVYWNDGIGKDIYGEVYDRKQKLGAMMVDPKYTPKQRAYYHDMRQGTKLILNSTTGKGDSHGQNSPIQMNNNIMSMRLIGQMFTWRIGQAQSLAGAKVVSTNTDGLYTVLDDQKLNADILKQQVKEIHVNIEPVRIYLISKDSNNREEEDVKTLKITTPSGGDLAAFDGPTTIRRLSHPAAIDRALGLYLSTMGNKNSKYYDQTLSKPFNKKLAMHILKNLYGDLSKMPTGKRIKTKQKLLNLFQNVVASSPGVDSYIFASKKYQTGLNEALLPKNVMDSITQTKRSYAPKKAMNLQLSLFGSSADELDLSNYRPLQQYNRIFYMNKDTDKTVHLYRAVGRKVNKNMQLSRKNHNLSIFNNSQLALYILSQNGVSEASLKKRMKEAKISRINNLSPAWPVLIVNQSLESLDEKQMDAILNNLDYEKYLRLLEHTFVANWCNNVAMKKVLKDKENLLKKKEAI